MTQTDLPTFTLGDRLAKAREWAGLTQEQMAARLGIGRRSIPSRTELASEREKALSPPRGVGRREGWGEARVGAMANVWVVWGYDQWEHFAWVKSVWTTEEAARAWVDADNSRFPSGYGHPYSVTEVVVDHVDGALLAEDAALAT